MANAGFFSSVLDLFSFSSRAEEQAVLNVNSQTASLLKPNAVVLNDDDAGANDLNIIEGSAITTSSGPLGTIVDVENIAPGNGMIEAYVVRKGDNISKIAKMFGVSANTIRWANDLNSDILKEGQTLVILPISGVKHIVKAGDTIQSIAKKYGGDAGEILKYNNINSGGKLAVGDEIIVPDGELKIPASVSSGIAAGSRKQSVSLPSYEGYYMKPAINVRKTQGLHGHNGVDLAPLSRTSGTEPFYASADGVVIISRMGSWNGGYGNYIVISHPNATQTLYSHNALNLVSVGDSVSKGQMIGYIGDTGKSTGSHLHFEVRGAKNPF